jgi:putative nucleotidyltransferase with HDIG domain
MKKLYHNLQHKHKTVYYILLFALTAGALLYVFPRKVQFKYDYQKGKSWQHKDLLAPFSFTIKKTDQELEAESKWLNAHKDLYFKKDNEVRDRVISSLKSAWTAFPISDSVKEIDSASFFKALAFVYARGIIDQADDDQAELDHKFLLVEENAVQRFLPSDFLTLQSALNIVGDALKQESDLLVLSRPYIKPNIIYDPARTQLFLKERKEQIIANTGLINQGDRIISEGNLIDDEKYLILESLREEYNNRQSDKVLPFQLAIGQLIYILILLITLYAFIHFFRRSVLEYVANVNLILFTVFWMVFLALTAIRINPNWLYVIPFPILPVIMRAFFDTRLALFVHIITILLVGYYAPNSFEFLFIEFIAGISAIINVTGLYKRSQLFIAAVKIIGVYIVSYLAFILLQESEIAVDQLYSFGYLMASGFFSLLAFPLIFIYEKIFGQVSDLTLLELADTNSPVLRELAQKAPGTFQHSMQVANLAERAALTIEANTLLVRTGALYHDIGKLYKPLFFVENQVTGVNPHDDLAFEESAEIIINHVIEGVQLAKKRRLPELIIDFIRTHHGTTRVEYFYHQYIKSFPAEEADVERFTYPGPKPFSKETAILMMADSVEAASRSLKEKTAENISQLVDGIIDFQMTSKQFDNADLTLREISAIKNVFKRQLANIYHARIEYPEKD